MQNDSGAPTIVLIFPVTRDNQSSLAKWKSAIDFVNISKINSFIVIDKTAKGVATKYFMENFNLKEKDLYILPRSIEESHYESLGGIEVDNNSWVMQLHDDDKWTGSVALPEITNPKAYYFSKFFMTNRSGDFSEQFNFLTPGRINFTLVPSHIWNQFSLFIQHQNFHVAGSLDSTLNQMVRLSCEPISIPDFSYYYDNHNWETRKSSNRSLKKLAINDGWESWASIDIALFSRLLDNLASLIYIQEFAKLAEINAEFTKLMKGFKPRFRRRVFLRLRILGLQISSIFTKLLSQNSDLSAKAMQISSKLKLYLFICDSWSVKNMNDVIQLIEVLERTENFDVLRPRFNSWKNGFLRLNILVGAK